MAVASLADAGPGGALPAVKFFEVAKSPFGGALLGGGAAGCMAKTATAPLARLTLLAQTSTLLAASAEASALPAQQLRGAALCRSAFANVGLVEGLRQLVRRDGFLALWKGNACTCMHRFWFTGLNFATFEQLRSRGLFGEALGGRFLCGAAATAAAVTACYPLDLVRARLMVDLRAGQASGILRTLASVQRTEGPGGLFRGLGPTLVASVPPIAISLCSYAPLKEGLGRLGFEEDSKAATVLAGGTSGMIGTAITFPFDVLRRRLQVGGMVGCAGGRSSVEEFMHIFRAEGPRGYFRGFKLEMIGVFPHVAILFLAYEALKPISDAQRLK